MWSKLNWTWSLPIANTKWVKLPGRMQLERKIMIRILKAKKKPDCLKWFKQKMGQTQLCHSIWDNLFCKPKSLSNLPRRQLWCIIACKEEACDTNIKINTELYIIFEKGKKTFVIALWLRTVQQYIESIHGQWVFFFCFWSCITDWNTQLQAQKL